MKPSSRPALRHLFEAVLLIASTTLASGTVAASGDFSYLDQSSWQAVSGDMQSPVAIESHHVIPTPARDGDKRLLLRNRPGPVRLVDTGHAWQVDMAPGNWAMLRGRRFELLEMHFHTPAEHIIDGRVYPVEGHLVYRASDGRLAVLAVMFEEGAANAGMTRLLDAWHRHGDGADLQFFMGALLTAPRDYFHYLGSLTTPPLSQNVEWYVQSQALSLSGEQIVQIRRIHAGNNRQVQPLNGRPVLRVGRGVAP